MFLHTVILLLLHFLPPITTPTSSRLFSPILLYPQPTLTYDPDTSTTKPLAINNPQTFPTPLRPLDIHLIPHTHELDPLHRPGSRTGRVWPNEIVAERGNPLRLAPASRHLEPSDVDISGVRGRRALIHHLPLREHVHLSAAPRHGGRREFQPAVGSGGELEGQHRREVVAARGGGFGDPERGEVAYVDWEEGIVY